MFRMRLWGRNSRPDVQMGHAFYPTLRAELGRDFALSRQVKLRPFIAAQGEAAVAISHQQSPVSD